MWLNLEANSGDDIAGIVESVGSDVAAFKKGDRVAAFHETRTEHGSFAEYAIAPASTTFHLPKDTTFEGGATIPLAYFTAVTGLFDSLSLPTPLQPATEPIPLLVYGASSAVGAYAVKLAKLANIHPIIGVAGAGSEFAKEIGCDVVVDRRKEDVLEGIKKALNGSPLKHVLDTVAGADSIPHIAKVLDSAGKITVLLPIDKSVSEPLGLDICLSNVGTAHNGSPFQKDLATAFYRLASVWLQDGRLQPHPHEVVPGGLKGVEEGLQRLQKGEISAKKLVFRIDEA